MFATGLECIRCHHEYGLEKLFSACPNCLKPGSSANLVVRYDYARLRNSVNRSELHARPFNSIWRFREFLPVEKREHMLELGDGCTPLIDAKPLAKKLGVKRLYIKDESRNLTWSFKDRLACTAIGKALDFKFRVTTCLSTGNHGAALAAHSSAAGLGCVVFTVPYVPKTMLVLMMMCGAMVVPIALDPSRFGDYPYDLMEKCVEEKGWYPAGTMLDPPANNAYGVDGYKTIGYEICEQLDWQPPEYVIFPTGHGDGISGTWRGFREFYDLGFVSRTPKMVAVQPKGAAPIVEAMKKGLIDNPPIIKAKPTAQFSTGVKSVSLQTITTLRESNGLATDVSDSSVLKMQQKLGKLQGIYAEQSSVSSVAALAKLVENGTIAADSTVVCVLTSGGLKDTEEPARHLPKISPIKDNWKDFETFLRRTYSFKIGN
jgi:threonine synthase